MSCLNDGANLSRRYGEFCTEKLIMGGPVRKIQFTKHISRLEASSPGWMNGWMGGYRCTTTTSCCLLKSPESADTDSNPGHIISSFLDCKIFVTILGSPKLRWTARGTLSCVLLLMHERVGPAQSEKGTCSNRWVSSLRICGISIKWVSGTYA